MEIIFSCRQQTHRVMFWRRTTVRGLDQEHHVHCQIFFYTNPCMTWTHKLANQMKLLWHSYDGSMLKIESWGCIIFGGTKKPAILKLWKSLNDAMKKSGHGRDKLLAQKFNCCVLWITQFRLSEFSSTTPSTLSLKKLNTFECYRIQTQTSMELPGNGCHTKDSLVNEQFNNRLFNLTPFLKRIIDKEIPFHHS